MPSLNVSLSFYVDGLGLLFALLISAIGALVFLYTGAYARGHRHFARLHVYLGLFMVAMLGLVGLALFAGFILLGSVGGSFELSALRANPEAVRAHALYGAILALVLCGVFTKSAPVPFHFWLPRAMAAPTPVSAYLHSATMVKAGVYLLARMHPLLAGTDAWLLALTSVGALTAVVGALLALRQTDLKLLLAYSTVMALGTLVMFLGAGAPIAIAAAITFLIVHALYKSALFLVAGVIDDAAGTRDLPRLGGLARAMPLSALAACVAALSMAGFPPFLGFVGKELKYEGALAIAGGRSRSWPRRSPPTR